MKSYKTAAALFYIASVLYFISALINFICGGNTSTGIMWLGLGAAFLCVGTVFKRKTDNHDNDGEKNNGK